MLKIGVNPSLSILKYVSETAPSIIDLSLLNIHDLVQVDNKIKTYQQKKQVICWISPKDSKIGENSKMH